MWWLATQLTWVLLEFCLRSKSIRHLRKRLQHTLRSSGERPITCYKASHYIALAKCQRKQCRTAAGLWQRRQMHLIRMRMRHSPQCILQWQRLVLVQYEPIDWPLYLPKMDSVSRQNTLMIWLRIKVNWTWVNLNLWYAALELDCHNWLGKPKSFGWKYY